MASRRIKEKKEEESNEENKEVEDIKEEKVDEVKEEKVSKEVAKEESDEITIDFSWIKKGLKKLTAEEDVEKKEEKKSNNDEVEIDFSWIKKGLKKLTEEDKTDDKKKEDEEDIQLDMKKIKGFFSLNKKKEGLNLGKIFAFLQKRQILLLLLIPLFLSFHFRIQTATLPLTEQLATDAVYNSLRSQLSAQVSGQYPNLPDRQRQEIVAESFQQLLESEKGNIEQQISAVTKQYRDKFQDDKGQTYLLAIDPYTYFREIRNKLRHGHIGDTLKDGKPYNALFLAPKGAPIKAGFHHYFGYYFHKVWSFFDRDAHLMKSFFYVPLFISMLAVIPAFFIALKFGGPVAGLFSSIMVAIHPAFLSRTPAGFSDTDAYNVFFPLLIAWLFLAAYDQPTFKRKLGLMSLAGFFIGLYSYAWTGWWAIFGFTLGTGAIYLAYFIFTTRNFKKIQNEIITFGTFFLSSMIFVSLFTSVGNAIGVFLKPFGFMRIKHAVGGASLWPNVYTTVAELNPISVSGAISQIGGKFLFYLAVAGIFLSFLKKKKDTKFDIRLGVLLALWFVATLYASTKGVRFVMLLVPAFSIALGIAIGVLYTKISHYLSAMIHIDKRIVKCVILILFLLLLIKPMQSASNTALHEIPSMTDAWWESLTEIKEQSAPDAIITSWWDFGHWFKAIAERGVTFDGASQTGHNAHFVGRSLLTSDEEETVGILRMLDCGQDLAFTSLIEQVDEVKAVDIIKEMQLVDRIRAKAILEREGVEDPENILQYTHCDPPEAYYITSEDMTQKSGVWSHFGSWDLRKAWMWQNVRGKSLAVGTSMIEELGYSPEEAKKLFNEVQGLQDESAANTWIAPWPSYGQTSPSGCSVNEEMVSCGNGLIVNTTTWDAYISAQGTLQRPVSLTYFDDEDIVQKKFSNVTTQVAAILIPTGSSSYNSMLAQPEHGMSIYTRLFYLDGHGLTHFEKFSDRRSVTGVRIIVWKVNWEGGSPRIAYNFTSAET